MKFDGVKVFSATKARDRIKRFRIGFCRVASPTNERSLVATLLPRNTIAGDSVFTFVFDREEPWMDLIWLCVANSWSMDFLVRKKVALNMTYTVMDSLPFPRLDRDHPVARGLVQRALRLICVAPEMIHFWKEIANAGWCSAWNTETEVPGTLAETERLRIRAEIDVIVARDLFSLSQKEINYILSTFPVAKRYEEAAHNESRSQRLINEMYASLDSNADVQVTE